MINKIICKSCAAVFAVLLTGCATALNFTVQKLPAMDTLGIKTLAVMPFETSDRSPLQRQAATWLTSEAESRIQEADHFTMVSSSQVDIYRQRKQNLSDYVDALFCGKIISLSVDNSSRQDTRTNFKTKEEYTVTVYERKVKLEFQYNIERARDGSIIGPLRKSDSAYSIAENDQGNLNTPETMVRSIIERNMRRLAQDVAPYTVTERRTLMKETSKDKAIKERAKYAGELVKSGNYKVAQEAYLAIYKDTFSFAAAFNACLLIAAQGDKEMAATFMQIVYNDTGNPLANAEVARLKKEMETSGLAAAYTENISQRDKLISVMVNEITNRMPKGAKPAILNNSREERTLADSVVHGITAGLLTKNITVVERGNQSLLAAERAYQLSGNVSDDSLISIGHEVGVTTFVLVSVSGSFTNRRLSVRMIDVEKNTVLYQSPPTDEMNL
ncbi:MAG: hypothetical protein LBU82_09045 [Treponema sp.]|jgi:TolB-like protein|nr:hypothetical protein [Treponema sp.]